MEFYGKIAFRVKPFWPRRRLHILLPFLLALVAIGLLAKVPRGRRIAWIGWGLLAALSTPFVGEILLGSLEVRTGDPLEQQAEAIVVLGGGTYFNAPEYGGDTVSRFTLERLRYAALLHRKSGRPLLVTGGNPAGNDVPEAVQMKAVLSSEWGIPVAWSEPASANTLENARNSYEMLSHAGIRRIYLVTHAWHMRRAMFAFEHAGFQVVPAPTHYTTRFRLTLQSFTPSSEGLAQSSIACQEALGMIWYRLRLM